MEPVGYPSFVLYLILLVGLPLAFFRPYISFLMVTFLLAAADAEAFTFTRTSFLGSYFNANDACLFIALSGTASYLSMGANFQFPAVCKWIIAVLIIGFFQSLYVLGWTYDVLRALRWAINLPVYFVIAATMVDDKDKVRPFLLALFIGSLVSAVEHILFVQARIPIFVKASYDISVIRTIAFRSPGVWFLLAGLVWLPEIKGLNRSIILAAGLLFALSVLLNQTRSIWISSVAALPISILIFRQIGIIPKVIKLSFVLSLLVAGVVFAMNFTIAKISAMAIVEQRVQTLVNEKERHYSTIKRQKAFNREITEWSNGTIILGRGLCYFQPYYKSQRMAWGHLGHVTTLAQLGLIGLFVYSFYLPAIIIRQSKELWLRATSQEVRFLGLLAGVCIIWHWICFFMSSSFLEQCPVLGIIFGAAWAQGMFSTDNVQMEEIHINGTWRKSFLHQTMQR